MKSSKFSNILRECSDQAKKTESSFRQVTDSVKMNWTDHRQKDFYAKHIYNQIDLLAELHREVNYYYNEVLRMENLQNHHR
jgi:hypothetical protein